MFTLGLGADSAEPVQFMKHDGSRHRDILAKRRTKKAKDGSRASAKKAKKIAEDSDARSKAKTAMKEENPKALKKAAKRSAEELV